MPSAPNRGNRKCETCLHFTDMREEWKGRYVQNPRSSSYNAHGYCEWKCPPILARLLWGEWGQRVVGLDEWCHCWEERPEGLLLDGRGKLTRVDAPKEITHESPTRK